MCAVVIFFGRNTDEWNRLGKKIGRGFCVREVGDDEREIMRINPVGGGSCNTHLSDQGKGEVNTKPRRRVHSGENPHAYNHPH